MVKFVKEAKSVAFKKLLLYLIKAKVLFSEAELLLNPAAVLEKVIELVDKSMKLLPPLTSIVIRFEKELRDGLEVLIAKLHNVEKEFIIYIL